MIDRGARLPQEKSIASSSIFQELRPKTDARSLTPRRLQRPPFASPLRLRGMRRRVRPRNPSQWNCRTAMGRRLQPKTASLSQAYESGESAQVPGRLADTVQLMIDRGAKFRLKGGHLGPILDQEFLVRKLPTATGAPSVALRPVRRRKTQ